MTVDLDLLYLYVASVLTSASEVNISNGHNSLISQARSPKFLHGSKSRPSLVNSDLGLSLGYSLHLSIGGQFSKLFNLFWSF